MKWSPLFLIILILGAFFAFFTLGRGALIDNDEAFYAQVVRESVENGNMLTLTKGGNNWFDKPPLVFWSAITLVKTFGWSEFLLRLPSAISLIICLILTYLIALELTNKKRVAILASLILLTTGLFWEAGRQLRLDVPVTACVLFSFFSYIKGLKNPRWFWGIGIGWGFGIMTKSVIGVFSVVPIFLYSLFYKKWDYLKSKHFYLGIIGGLLIGLPWHIYEWVKYPTDFYNLYIVKFIFTRVHENILGGVSTNSNYIINLLTYYQPWCIVGFVCAIAVCIWMKSCWSFLKMPVVFMTICAFLFAIFFVSSTKLLYYFIPIYPFVAIFIALSFDSLFIFIETQYPQHKGFLTFIIVITFVFSTVASLPVTFSFGDNYFSETRGLAEDEKTIGQSVSKSPFSTHIYTDNYFFWDTIAYYSGGRRIQVYNKATAEKPFYLVQYRGDRLLLSYVE
ncbi:MAG: phospholipid carrier-dependent glycosyltransferase [Candidatus Taylorbacteria bacterium]|nr:phospholipid carrier-dependent glycosyltransferase [Candidatus Taylorbacteria bacterium]